jgi:hypothetical protein
VRQAKLFNASYFPVRNHIPRRLDGPRHRLRTASTVNVMDAVERCGLDVNRIHQLARAWMAAANIARITLGFQITPA